MNSQVEIGKILMDHKSDKITLQEAERKLLLLINQKKETQKLTCLRCNFKIYLEIEN